MSMIGIREISIKFLPFVAIIGAFLAMTGCKEEPLLPVEYIQWVEHESNGLKQRKELGDFTFEVQYKPAEYVILKSGNPVNIDPAKVEIEKKELEDMQYFNFRIGRKDQSGQLLQANLSNTDEYFKRIEYLAFKAQKDFKLVEDGDTIPCLIYHFERNYGLAPYNDIVLAFPKNGQHNNNATPGDKNFIYDDNVFGLGMVKFMLRQEDINRVPNLLIL